MPVNLIRLKRCVMNKKISFLKSSLDVAVGALRRQKGRTLLTMMAIAIGIGSVITISAAGKGVERFVLGQLDIFGADTMYVEPHVPHGSGGGPGDVGIVITSLDEKDLETILKHPNVVAGYGMVTGQEAVSYGGQLKKIMLNGRGHRMMDVEPVILTEGRMFTEDEEASIASVTVLGSSAKEKLFGDDTAVGKTVLVRGRPYKVVGVAGPRGSAFFIDMDNVLIIPTKTMQKKLLGINYFQAISAKLVDGNKAKETKAELTELIRENHEITDPNKDDFMVNTTDDAQETLSTVTGGLTLLLLALVCISLVVGGVGIMNIMYVSVAERTFEIGLRKSLGATKKDILWQFLTEAVLITIGGGITGIILGALVAFVIYLGATSLGFKWIYTIPLPTVLLAIVFSGTIGLLFGLYPAKKAAELSPIDALRKE